MCVGGVVGSASLGSQTCKGAPLSPESQHPAVPVNSLPGYCPPGRPEASDGCHDRKCPPAQPTQTAPPFPAAPSPRARPTGPGSPDSRGRCNRLGRPISRPLSLALAAAPPHQGTANPKRIQKKRETPLPSSDHPLSVASSMHPCTPKAPYPGETVPHHHHGRKIPRHPLGAAVETQSPRRQVPGHTITLKLWGRGTGICTGIPQIVHGNGGAIALFLQSRLSRWPGPDFPRLLRARPCPALPGHPNLARPNLARHRRRGGSASAPRGSTAPKHSPRPGCAPRGPAPSPINGML